MSYTVTVNHPHFAEGYPFSVEGLDKVPNGGSIEVDEEMERMFVIAHGHSFEDAFNNNAVVSISGSSALDRSELDSLVETYGPQPEVSIDELESMNKEELVTTGQQLGVPVTPGMKKDDIKSAIVDSGSRNVTSEGGESSG